MSRNKRDDLFERVRKWQAVEKFFGRVLIGLIVLGLVIIVADTVAYFCYP